MAQIIFKEGDVVRVKRGAYNITDKRVGMTAKVTRIDYQSKQLPVRIQYDSDMFNWTNHESLEMVQPAASQNAAVGKEILDRMVALREAIATRDDAIKTVVEQTEALDALLASVGLKRGEEVPPAPVRVKGPLTALDAVVDGSVKEGQTYRMTQRDVDFFSLDEEYIVEALDLRDKNQPISFLDDDGDEVFPDRAELKYFERVI